MTAECDRLNKEKLWNMCTRLGIPKPGSGKRADVAADTLRDACCEPNTLAIGSLLTKRNAHKVVKRVNLARSGDTELGDNRFVVLDPRQKKHTFVKCQTTNWGSKSRTNKKVGTFIGQTCGVIECINQKCSPKIEKDIVTIRSFAGGRSLGINKPNISDFYKDNFNRI